MSNLSTTPPRLSDSSAAAANSTFLGTAATALTPIPDVTANITANDIVSRANYVYSCFAALGLVAACFLLYGFVQTYRAQRRLAWLDCLLWAFCGFQLLLLLLSLYAAAHRPDALRTMAQGCAVLSFTINATCVCGLFVLLLVAYVLTLDPPSHALLKKPAVCAALVGLASVVIALVLAGIRGLPVQENNKCFMDPLNAGVSYAAAKMCLVFLIPYMLKTGFLVCGCVRQRKSKGRFLSGSEEGPVFLAVTAVMLFCQLFYHVVLVRAAKLHREKALTHGEVAFLRVAEFVLFAGSSASLLIVLFMHRPCRESVCVLVRQLRDCCRSPVRTQPNRNIIAPHIEITDTLQDIES